MLGAVGTVASIVAIAEAPPSNAVTVDELVLVTIPSVSISTLKL